MASPPTLVSVDEYLRTSFSDGDREYVDGRIVERNLGEKNHSKTQGELIYFFRANRGNLGTYAFPEQRVQVKPARFRVPDVCVYIGKEPEEQLFRTPPFLVIEILSKEDRLRDLEDKVRDYLEFSVPYVWVIDPAAKRGYICTREGKQEAAEGVLETDNPSIELDLKVLF